MKKFFLNRKLNILYSVLAVLAMWVIWIIAFHAVGNRLLVPSWSETFKEIWLCFKSADFWKALWGTLVRTLISFVVSFALAGICAAISCVAQPFRAAFRPVVAFVRILPTLAVILLILRWTENDKNIAPVIVTVLVLFPMIYAQITAAVDGIDGGLKDFIKVYGIKRNVALFKIYLPAVCPNVLAQTGANVSLGLKIMVSGEVLAFTLNGVGGLMQSANLAAMTARLAALTLIVVAAGIIIDLIFSQSVRITYKWSKKDAK